MSTPPDKLNFNRRLPEGTLDDKSLELATVPKAEWERLNDQRDRMIDAMTTIFKWLNGAIVGFVFIAWLAGLFVPDYRVITERSVMALIAATVVQAGMAFLTITKFFFQARTAELQVSAVAPQRPPRPTIRNRQPMPVPAHASLSPAPSPYCRSP